MIIGCNSSPTIALRRRLAACLVIRVRAELANLLGPLPSYWLG